MGESRRRKLAGPGAPTDASDPGDLSGAWNSLRKSDLHAAKAAFAEALKRNPNRAEAWKGTGMVALADGAAEAAIQLLSRCVELAPKDVEARTLLAQALQLTGRVETSRAEWLEVTRQAPEDADSWESLGIVEQGIGNATKAADCYQRAFALRPSLALRAKMATLVSPIVASRAAIDVERHRMDQRLDELLTEPLWEPLLDDPMRAALWTNFYLAYHGKPDRELQVKTSQMYRRIIPSLSHVSARCHTPTRRDRPVRIGLISQFFHNHSIGRTSRGLFAQLNKGRFAVIAIFIAPVIDDEYSRFIRHHATRSISVPQDLAAARQMIEAEELDILFYQDIGMEPFSYFLAHSRLAPVQCVSFGHPDTTGISTIDYFVSSDLYESSSAASHYSERLYLLHNLGSLAYYYRPELPSRPKSRADFALSDASHLYVCPQNLFKIHPDMDDLLAGTLRRDPRGRIVMVAGKIANWTGLLRNRWARSIPDVADRIVFLPRMSSQDYVNLIAVSDVMLDTVHFNGMNTSLEAFAVGTPVVTFPGEFQRGRHTQAMYRRMGITDCIASDKESYIETAVRIASDEVCRSNMKQRINQSSVCLYEDPGVIREFERFFLDAVARAALESTAEVDASDSSQ